MVQRDMRGYEDVPARIPDWLEQSKMNRQQNVWLLCDELAKGCRDKHILLVMTEID